MNFLKPLFAKNERNFLFQKVEAHDIFFFFRKVFYAKYGQTFSLTRTKHPISVYSNQKFLNWLKFYLNTWKKIVTVKLLVKFLGT